MLNDLSNFESSCELKQKEKINKTKQGIHKKNIIQY